MCSFRSRLTSQTAGLEGVVFELLFTLQFLVFSDNRTCVGVDALDSAVSAAEVLNATGALHGALEQAVCDIVDAVEADVLSLASAMQDPLARVEDVRNTVALIVTAAGELIDGRSADPVDTTYFYLVDTGRTVLRGTAAAAGITGGVFLLPNELYFFAIYDPATRAYGTVAARTSGNGRITMIPPMLLSGVDVFFPADQDSDGLVDVAERVRRVPELFVPCVALICVYVFMC